MGRNMKILGCERNGIMVFVWNGMFNVHYDIWGNPSMELASLRVRVMKH